MISACQKETRKTAGDYKRRILFLITPVEICFLVLPKNKEKMTVFHMVNFIYFTIEFIICGPVLTLFSFLN